MRTTVVTIGLVGLTLGACKPPPEAPEGINNLSVYLTTNFDDEDELVLATGLANLEIELDALDLEADINADENGRAFSLDAITEADLGGMTAQPLLDITADGEEQVAVGVAGLSSTKLQDNIDLVAEANQICIESATTKYYGRTYETDIACFVDGSCATLSTTNEVRKESLLGKAWYDLEKDYRIVEMEDGRQAMISRSFTEKQFLADNEGKSWDMLYTIEAWIPSEDGNSMKRWYGYWTVVKIGAGPDFLRNTVRDGIDEGYRYADEFVNGGDSCREDRDREYDRE